MLAVELPLHLNFMAFAIPGAVAALAMTVFAISARHGEREAPWVDALEVS